MRDFTIDTYLLLLDNLAKANYTAQCFRDICQTGWTDRQVCLRHDVDKRFGNSLVFARIQYQRGLRATYYFRTTRGSFDEKAIREIESLGHEIGYHYETMDICRGNVDEAYQLFCRELERFRKICDIQTICMHGSPLSKFDNRDLWKKYNYRDLGIIGEPYFDIDFSQVAYYTDTGRRWDGGSFSIRDKPIARSGGKHFAGKPVFHRTTDMVYALETGAFPGSAMLTFHPQRWTQSTMDWTLELLTQSMKNWVKKAMLLSGLR